uniref:ARAD1C42438p n=1 Tax=Blastobotrys adeninivorans TaxID=409370 RepID=A0A060T478_BLAAD
MSLIDLYKDFRARPRSDALTDTATVSYVSSGAVFAGIQHILEHYAKSEYEFSLEEEILCTHEAKSSVVLETRTRITFLRGPGPFVPTLSLNFVADEKVTVYLTHIVQFDDKNKISAIRLLWDQASVLKQLSVIGSRGNAWPITLGDAQTKTVELSLSGKGASTSPSPSNTSSTPNGKSSTPFKSWPNAINVFDVPPMDPVPVRPSSGNSESSAGPSSTYTPIARPPSRSLQDILEMTQDLSVSPRPETPSKTYSNGRPYRTSTVRSKRMSATAALFGLEDD